MLADTGVCPQRIDEEERDAIFASAAAAGDGRPRTQAGEVLLTEGQFVGALGAVCELAGMPWHRLTALRGRIRSSGNGRALDYDGTPLLRASEIFVSRNPVRVVDGTSSFGAQGGRSDPLGALLKAPNFPRWRPPPGGLASPQTDLSHLELSSSLPVGAPLVLVLVALVGHGM